VVGSNLYWLSSKPETLDWRSRTGTPRDIVYADYTACPSCPSELKVADHTNTSQEAITHVTLENPSKSLRSSYV